MQRVGDKAISLVDADPELAELLDDADYEAARREALARVQRLSPGVWDAAAALERDSHHRGFLISTACWRARSTCSAAAASSCSGTAT